MSVWAKGQSGNPSGRPKHFKLLSDAIKLELLSDERKPRAIAVRLVRMAIDPEADPKVALAAAQLLLDRLEGKAAQTVDVAIDHQMTLTIEERRGRIAELERLRRQATAIDAEPEEDRNASGVA